LHATCNELENHKKGKKIEEKNGLSSNTMEEELEINKKKTQAFSAIF
jgi:hypothetical protein